MPPEADSAPDGTETDKTLLHSGEQEGPPAKKVRLEGRQVTLATMTQRNEEFDKFLKPAERNCMELRSALQLCFTFKQINNPSNTTSSTSKTPKGN